MPFFLNLCQGGVLYIADASGQQAITFGAVTSHIKQAQAGQRGTGRRARLTHLYEVLLGSVKTTAASKCPRMSSTQLLMQQSALRMRCDATGLAPHALTAPLLNTTVPERQCGVPGLVSEVWLSGQGYHTTTNTVAQSRDVHGSLGQENA